MRVFVLVVLFFAGAANAAPNCVDRPVAQPSQLIEYEPLSSVEFPTVAVSSVSGRLVDVSIRPALRPCKFQRIALGRAQMLQRGAVCGDWTILGQVRQPISGKFRGCGIADPVRIYRVADVALSQLALMDCQTAVTLKTWIENTAKPAFEGHGGGLKGIRLSGHYSCRTKNNQRHTSLSEHARGRAIDISEFVLRDGTRISILAGWNADGTGDILRQLHSGACGVFGTVLGPGSDRFHKDHFHLDTAYRRSGPYCK